MFFLAKMVFLDVYEIFDQKRTQVVDWWWNIHATPVYPKAFFPSASRHCMFGICWAVRNSFVPQRQTTSLHVSRRQAWRGVAVAVFDIKGWIDPMSPATVR